MQIGDPDYRSAAREQCVKYRWLLANAYKVHHGHPLPPGLHLKIVSNEHDFGTYYEVGVAFDTSDEEAAEAAFWLEANGPTKWEKGE